MMLRNNYRGTVSDAMRSRLGPKGTVVNSQGWSEAEPLVINQMKFSPNGATVTSAPLGLEEKLCAYRSRGSAALHPWLLTSVPSGLKTEPSAGPDKTPSFARRANMRSGFTLLEVLLASAIALLLLAALYVAFDVTIRQTDSSREAVSQGDLARAITNRMNIDLACCVGPMPPKSGGGVPPDDAATPTTPSSGTGTNTTASNSTLSSAEVAAGTATGTVDLTESEGETAGDLPFQGGLFGSETTLTMFVSKVPTGLSDPKSGRTPLPDLRRVTYYMSARGLCRQEKPWVTADGIRNSSEPVSGVEDQDLIAEEVKSISFEYIGASGPQSTWLGSDLASDGGSVQGPPRAIRITMVIQLPGSEQQKTVQHVIPVRASIGLYVPPVPEEETTETTTTGM